METVRLKAAALLLERGIRYRIKDAPLLWRIFRLNRIHIRPLYAGAILEMSILTELYELDKVKTPDDAARQVHAIAHVIAVAMLNGRLKIRLFAGILTRLLLRKIPAYVLADIFANIAEINRVLDFTIITGYLSGQAAAMMSPKNPGQTEKGS
jgi:hypothetical protein